MNLIAENRLRDLYLLDPGTNRVVFMPRYWCDEMRQDDEDDGICISCWYGNDSVLAYQERESKEWLSTDACELMMLSDLEQMREISEEEARKIDPDLFTLLEAINSGKAI